MARLRENAFYALAELYLKPRDNELPADRTHREGDIQNLFRDIRPLFVTLPKARTAKIVRTLMDIVAKAPNTEELQGEICKEILVWYKEGKRTFLRHRAETRHVGLLHRQGKYQQGLEAVSKLLGEVKRLDDKLLLVEIHLLESRLLYSIRNVPKSKAALTAARTNATAIHCPPLLQADIDLMAGIIHAEEKDYKTAYSYFYEAFEAFNVADDPRALQALKYMMLAKIMCGQPEEVTTISSGKPSYKYLNADIEALQLVAKCHHQRSLGLFDKTLSTHGPQLQGDPIIQRHISDLYQVLIEQNILKVLEPFSRVEIDHIAHLAKLPVERVHAKLSEMILDKKLDAMLDQGVGVLELFEKPSGCDLYEDALATFKNMSQVVDALCEKAAETL